MKFYKYGTQVFYKQLMDILYVNAEGILQKTSLFKNRRTQEKTRSSWSSLRSKRFLASSSRKLRREQKKRNDGGGGGEWRNFFFFLLSL